MLIAVDTHVHMYPCHDSGRALTTLLNNLSSLGRGQSCICAACLTERADCHWFEEVRDGTAELPDGWRLSETLDGDPSVVLMDPAGERLYVIAGSQIRTAERLEVLALATDQRFEDGLPVRDALNAVLDAGGVPVLTWAVGKWTFKRASIVKDLIENPGETFMMIGDSSLRAAGRHEPKLFELAHSKGITVLAGSDSLPMKNEEQYLGTYATLLEDNFDAGKPAASIITALLDGNSAEQVGKRCGALTSAVRVLRYASSS